MEKIINFKHVSSLVNTIKHQGEKLVLVGGCFDILHLGHVRFLKAAKKHGVVIVALESDENLKKYKGLARPIHQQAERAEVLASLDTVDYIIILPSFTTDQDYFDLTKTVSPDVIVVTAGDPQLANKQKQAKMVGGKLITIPKIKTPSTSQLVKLLELEKI